MIKDLTQDVFIAAGAALPAFRGDSKVSTWLYTIASRIVLNHLDSWRRHRRMLANLESAQLPAPADNIESRLMQQQELRLVWRCLLRIKPKKRIVFVLHQIEGRPGAEIAELLQINEATVWTRLHHARRELTELVQRARKGEAR